MIVHVVDGTYELFRYFFAVPSHVTDKNREVGGTRGVVGSMLSLLEAGATHVGIATDHIIESFRNDLLASYKTGAGIERALFAQFHPLEEALDAMGVAGVAVYAEDDYASRHVALAGEAVSLGSGAAAQTYLDQAKILAAARATGAQAIHPGYGFLSENAAFAESCEAAGIHFIGPTPAQMRAFGLKHTARDLAQEGPAGEFSCGLHKEQPLVMIV